MSTNKLMQGGFSYLFFLYVLFVLSFFNPLSVVAQEVDFGTIFKSVSVDLKVNGQDGPVTVGGDSRVTVSWVSDGATRCRGNWSRNDLKLNDKIIGKVSKSVVVRVACINADGDRDNDSVAVQILGNEDSISHIQISRIKAELQKLFNTHRDEVTVKLDNAIVEMRKNVQRAELLKDFERRIVEVVSEFRSRVNTLEASMRNAFASSDFTRGDAKFVNRLRAEISNEFERLKETTGKNLDEIAQEIERLQQKETASISFVNYRASGEIEEEFFLSVADRNGNPVELNTAAFPRLPLGEYRVTASVGNQRAHFIAHVLADRIALYDADTGKSLAEFKVIGPQVQFTVYDGGDLDTGSFAVWEGGTRINTSVGNEKGYGPYYGVSYGVAYTIKIEQDGRVESPVSIMAQSPRRFEVRALARPAEPPPIPTPPVVNNPPTIKPSIIILSPRGNAGWERGKQYALVWEISSFRENRTNFSIELLDAADVPVPGFGNINGEPFQGSRRIVLGQGMSNSYQVVLANSLSNQRYKFRISLCPGDGAATQCLASDPVTLPHTTSDTFVVTAPTFAQPSITILSPNGVETLQSGRTYVIRWSASGFTSEDKVYIAIRDYSAPDPTSSDAAIINPGSSDTILNAGETSATQGWYDWVIPPGFKADSKYKVSVYAVKQPITDSSDSYFTVISQPAPPSTSEERDARRKSDLNTISAALELYYKAKGVYPDGECVWSSSSCWYNFIGVQYMANMPVDPLNTDLGGCGAEKECHLYRYCQFDNRKKFVLAANLENPSNSPMQNYAACTSGGPNFYWISGQAAAPTEQSKLPHSSFLFSGIGSALKGLLNFLDF